MALKKDYPVAFKKLRDAQKIIEKAVAGGLLDDLGAHVYRFGKRPYWTVYDYKKSQEAYRRLRALLPEGVRLLWEENQCAHDARLSVETGDGRLTAKAGSTTGQSKYAEG